jgi:hypothetical protein
VGLGPQVHAGRERLDRVGVGGGLLLPALAHEGQLVTHRGLDAVALALVAADGRDRLDDRRAGLGHGEGRGLGLDPGCGTRAHAGLSSSAAAR